MTSAQEQRLKFAQLKNEVALDLTGLGFQFGAGTTDHLYHRGLKLEIRFDWDQFRINPESHFVSVVRAWSDTGEPQDPEFFKLRDKRDARTISGSILQRAA